MLDPFRRSAEGQPSPVVILDGGLATTLEARGFDLDDPLWSAKLLLEAPDAVRRVHHAFLEAGADVIATISYQASVEGFARRGIDREGARALIRRSVDLAVEARDHFWSVAAHREGRRRPWVAASVGPYGAFLADGSEYTGDYGVDRVALRAFHRDRWHLFAASPADLLACETIPSGPETDVLLHLAAETPERAVWLSFSCRDAAHLADGTPLAAVARSCDGVPNVVAVGVNCTKPENVLAHLTELRRGTDKPLLAYPNAGETYDAATRSWHASPSDLDWTEEATAWVRAGARGVGGCCRVMPEQIAALRHALRA